MAKNKTLILAGTIITIGVFLWGTAFLFSVDTYTKTDRARAEIVSLVKIIDHFRKEQTVFPQNLDELRVRRRQGGETYLNINPIDPWGRKYGYQYPGMRNVNSYDLWSYGADGQPGGSGENADIINPN